MADAGTNGTTIVDFQAMSEAISSAMARKVFISVSQDRETVTESEENEE